MRRCHGIGGTLRQLTGPRTLVSPRKLFCLLTLCALLSYPAPAREPSYSQPATLQAKTLAAFSDYVKQTDARNSAELKQAADLLWVDSLSAEERKAAYATLAQGQIRIERRQTSASGKAITCPGGLIHHWEGVIFIPGARVDDALRVLQDYDRHAVFYSPDVERSRLESREGDHFRVYLRFRRKKVITVVLNTEHDVTYFRDSQSLAHSRSSATRISEVDDPGKPDEREKSHHDDGGYLWGMETWWRFQEKDGGVYVQSEVVSLTRDIPTGLAWMIGPFVNSIPRETLTFTLEATRKAVLQQMQSAKTRQP